MIDFHCHLDLYPDPEREIRDVGTARVYVLSVTTTPRAWVRTAQLAKGHTRIRTALGLHPQLAHERVDELGLFEELLARSRYVGEIGLDGGPGYGQHSAVQTKVFDAVLRLAGKGGGRIMSIHSRRAVDEILDRLAVNADAGTPILHWFSGTAAQLRRATDIGCWFSVGPAMLGGEKGRSLAKAMPRDRILTETDGPFASGSKGPLHPVDAWQAVKQLAAIWGMPLTEAQSLLLENLRSLSASGPDHLRGRTSTGQAENN
ncbi:Qat anti-phage system TatD family nuclease QatD [Inquilinus limosus]|uniref:Qat anti-phage system TatD family nuclease QatD n=1 Tax=Inquilinus limosus TaxID=171674 RepID=UPI0009DBD31E|nr:Qat anti-phage system TatD family nuclease QatD [Inquilinus limosus]